MSEVGYNQDSLYANKVTIYTEANPNPQSMKFMLNFMLVPEGENFDYPDLESTKGKSPLAEALFGLDYVKRVFFMSNFITITKSEDKDWVEVIPEIKPFIKEYLEAKKPIFTEDETKRLKKEEAAIDTADTEAIKKIKGILDEYIKPAVEMDGGAIQFHSFAEEEGVLKVLLQGSCSGCPSSTVTLKAGIENMMTRMVPQVKEVIAEGV